MAPDADNGTTLADAFCGYCGGRLPLTTSPLERCPSCEMAFKDTRPTVRATTPPRASEPRDNSSYGPSPSSSASFERAAMGAPPPPGNPQGMPASWVDHTRDPAVALVLAAVLPGAGQVYNGQFFKGLFIFLTCWLVVPWLFGMLDAYITAKKTRYYEPMLNGFRERSTSC